MKGILFKEIDTHTEWSDEYSLIFMISANIGMWLTIGNHILWSMFTIMWIVSFIYFLKEEL